MMRRTISLLLPALLVLGACGGGGDEPRASSSSTETAAGDAGSSAFEAAVASYEIVAGKEGRLIVGLFTPDQRVISFGTVDFELAYLGTEDAPLGTPRPGPRVEAAFYPLAGQPDLEDLGKPTVVARSKGAGVYQAGNLMLPDAGFWQVTVRAKVDGKESSKTAKFAVVPEPLVPFPGEPAPRTKNHVAGTPGVPAKAIDSRAEEGQPIPAPTLHDTVIADAIAAGRPVMVVVSTPVYCVSKFCGPITDSVEQLSLKYGDQMDFVHLEVWRNFEAKPQQINAAATEWIFKKGTQDATEPWVFLVGRDGIITDRWDNVASDQDLEAAVQRTIA